MEIITSLPKYSDGEINKAFERELRTGMQLKKAWEERREIRAAAEAKEMANSREVPGLGKHVGSMPAWEFFRLNQKYGHQEVHSDEFLRYFQKKFPHLSTNKI